MHTNRKILLLLTFFAFVLALVGCSGEEGVQASFKLAYIEVTYIGNVKTVYNSDTDHDTVKPMLGLAGTKLTFYDDGTYQVTLVDEDETGYFMASTSGTYVFVDDIYTLTDGIQVSKQYTFELLSDSELRYAKNSVMIIHDNSPRFGENANFVFYFNK